jgi:hypothetical protein
MLFFCFLFFFTAGIVMTVGFVFLFSRAAEEQEVRRLESLRHQAPAAVTAPAGVHFRQQP